VKAPDSDRTLQHHHGDKALNRSLPVPSPQLRIEIGSCIGRNSARTGGAPPSLSPSAPARVREIDNPPFPYSFIPAIAPQLS